MAHTLELNNGIVYTAGGTITGEGEALTLNVGFNASRVRLVNLTDRISYEWFKGSPNGTTLKTVAAGTRTLDTGDAAISVDGKEVTLSAAALISGKSFAYEVVGR